MQENFHLSFCLPFLHLKTNFEFYLTNMRQNHG